MKEVTQSITESSQSIKPVYELFKNKRNSDLSKSDYTFSQSFWDAEIGITGING